MAITTNDVSDELLVYYNLFERKYLEQVFGKRLLDDMLLDVHINGVPVKYMYTKVWLPMQDSIGVENMIYHYMMYEAVRDINIEQAKKYFDTAEDTRKNIQHFIRENAYYYDLFGN
jgi:hypothetical protein